MNDHLPARRYCRCPRPIVGADETCILCGHYPDKVLRPVAEDEAIDAHNAELRALGAFAAETAGTAREARQRRI